MLTGSDEVEVLVVEDNPGDARLLEEALHDASIAISVQVVTDGAEALDYLHQRNEFESASPPDLILLDWLLPRVNGAEVLNDVKSDPVLRQIPVVVLSSSESELDIVTSYDDRANAYVTKPVDPDEFLDLVRAIGNFWIRIARLPPTDGE